MDLKILLELMFGLLTVASAAWVAFSPKLLHAGFSLLFTFFGVAGLYVMLGADFLAATQVLVYIGGVLVLLLFGILLTTALPTAELTGRAARRGKGLALGALLLVLLLAAIFRANWPLSYPPLPETTAAQIGRGFMTSWLLPFEVASILLLGAMLGALHLARRGGEER
ncbi:MAG: NADH-quinone oxidoreductase subunit J [bacterium]|jgi:NADH-quinone oxidoreductase subunit J|nr:NADH-quinone oxidoreductase subunit J [bacterium]